MMILGIFLAVFLLSPVIKAWLKSTNGWNAWYKAQFNTPVENWAGSADEMHFCIGGLFMSLTHHTPTAGGSAYSALHPRNRRYYRPYVVHEDEYSGIGTE